MCDPGLCDHILHRRCRLACRIDGIIPLTHRSLCRTSVLVLTAATDLLPVSMCMLSPTTRPVAPPATQTQSESTEAVEQVPAVAQFGGHNEARHTSRPGFRQQQREQALESTKHVESHSENCARPNEQTDGNKHNDRGSRQNHRQRYPPPPGPPPSPTPAQVRGNTSPYQGSSSQSQERRGRSEGERERERRANVVRSASAG